MAYTVKIDPDLDKFRSDDELIQIYVPYTGAVSSVGLGDFAYTQNRSTSAPNFFGLTYMKGLKTTSATVNDDENADGGYFTFQPTDTIGTMRFETKGGAYVGNQVELRFDITDEKIHVDNPIVIDQTAFPNIEDAISISDGSDQITFNGRTITTTDGSVSTIIEPDTITGSPTIQMDKNEQDTDVLKVYDSNNYTLGTGNVQTNGVGSTVQGFGTIYTEELTVGMSILITGQSTVFTITQIIDDESMIVTPQPEDSVVQVSFNYLEPQFYLNSDGYLVSHFNPATSNTYSLGNYQSWKNLHLSGGLYNESFNTDIDYLVNLGKMEFSQGTFGDRLDTFVDTPGGSVIFQLTPDSGGPYDTYDFPVHWSDGVDTITITYQVNDTLSLTLGTVEVPQPNYLYWLKSTDTFTKSTTEWPATEHVKVAYLEVTTQADYGSNGFHFAQYFYPDAGEVNNNIYSRSFPEVRSMQFATDYVESSHEEGKMHWDGDAGTVAVGMPGGKVELQVGQEGLKRCRNTTGSTIENGSLVYTTGSSGQKPLIDLCDNTDADKIHMLGMATEDIANNSNGYVALWGKVRGDATEPIDTDFAVGTKLYMSTAGTFTTTHPSNPTHAVIVIGESQNESATEGQVELNSLYFTIGNNYDGTLRQSVINKSTGTSAGASFTAVNDQGYRTSLSIFGDSHSTLPNVAGLYNSGYGDTAYVTDGNKSHKWYTDSTDSHDFSALDVTEMELDPSGNLTNIGYASNLNFTTSSHYTGFPNRDDTSLGWDDGTATFTLTATDDKIWIDGVEYEIDTLQVQLPSGQDAPSGLYWIWATAPGGTPQLNTSTTQPGFGVCLTAAVYWNTTTNKGLLNCERHWMGRDKWMHEYLHETVGARYADGMAGTFNDATFSIAAGEFYDEDIEHENIEETVATLLYHDGDADWVWDAATATPYKEVNSNLVYNDGTTLTEATANRFVNYYVYMTPDVVDPVHIFIGTAQYTTLAGAQAAPIPSLGDLPGAENKLIYSIIYKNSATIAWQHTTDFRASNPSGSTYIPVDHGTLAGLTDDDHTQYLLADGTRPLTGTWTTGAQNIIADKIGFCGTTPSYCIEVVDAAFTNSRVFKVDIASDSLSTVVMDFDAEFNSSLSDGGTAVLRSVQGIVNTQKDRSGQTQIEGSYFRVGDTSVTQTQGIRNVKGVITDMYTNIATGGTQNITGLEIIPQQMILTGGDCDVNNKGIDINRSSTVLNLGSGALSSIGLEISGYTAGIYDDEIYAIKVVDGDVYVADDITDGTATFTVAEAEATIDFVDQDVTSGSNPTFGDIKGETKSYDITILNPNGAYDNDTQVPIALVKSNMTITKLDVSLNATGNQVAGDVKWASDLTAFTGATLINDFDTTSGVRTDSSITAGAVAAGKWLYLQFDSQPHADITFMTVHIEWDYT